MRTGSPWRPCDLDPARMPLIETEFDFGFGSMMSFKHPKGKHCNLPQSKTD